MKAMPSLPGEPWFFEQREGLQQWFLFRDVDILEAEARWREPRGHHITHLRLDLARSARM
jgi:hypothetical protein